MRESAPDDTLALIAPLTDPQAERIQQRLTRDTLKVIWREEQRGPDLIVRIGCSPAQENRVRSILQELGVSLLDEPSDDQS